MAARNSSKEIDHDEEGKRPSDSPNVTLSRSADYDDVHEENLAHELIKADQKLSIVASWCFHFDEFI